MSQNNQSIEELYSFMFAVRISLQDNYDNESDIIIELKKYLVDAGENYSTINQTLYGFYQYYDINIDITTIEQATNNDEQILNNMLGFIMGVNNNLNFNIPNISVSNDIPDNEVSNVNPVNANNNDNDDANDANDASSANDDHADLNEENNDINQPSSIASNHVFSFQILSNGQLINMPLSQTINTHTNMTNFINTMINGLENNIQLQQPNNIFQDVVVTVDDKDIEKLQSTKLESDKDSDCSICMGHMEKDEMVTELKCKHTFHTECIETYLKQYNHKCPVCRSEVGSVKYNF